MRKYAGGSLASTTTYKPASALNQMLGWRTGEINAVYTYDANGNRQDKFIIIDGENDATNYEYDEDNRLVKVILRDIEKPKEYTFAYDYRTRRISRETPTEKTLHVFDGGLSVQEYLVEATPSSLTLDNLTTESIRGEGMGGGVGGMVYSVRNGQLEASHSNHRGDVIARTDNTGNLTWFARYHAYGTRFHEVGATYDRQRGNTKDEEEPLSLSFQGMRPLGLEHGVWLTPDPIGISDGPNRYLYVHNNPITGFDPLGLTAAGDALQNKMIQWASGADAGVGKAIAAAGANMMIGAVDGIIESPRILKDQVYDFATDPSMANIPILGPVGTKAGEAFGNLSVDQSGDNIREAVVATTQVVGTALGGVQAGRMAGVPGTKGNSLSSSANKNSGSVTRYMTEGEAKEALRTRNIPNYGPDGKPRPTHVTTDRPINSASKAAKKYEITTPTHRATVPASRAGKLNVAPDGRPITSGGGSQRATSKSIPIKPREIKRLED